MTTAKDPACISRRSETFCKPQIGKTTSLIKQIILWTTILFQQRNKEKMSNFPSRCLRPSFIWDVVRNRLAVGYQLYGKRDGYIFKSQAVQEND